MLVLNIIRLSDNPTTTQSSVRIHCCWLKRITQGRCGTRPGSDGPVASLYELPDQVESGELEVAKASASTTPGARNYVDWQVVSCATATRPAPDWTVYLRNYVVPIDGNIVFAAPDDRAETPHK